MQREVMSFFKLKNKRTKRGFAGQAKQVFRAAFLLPALLADISNYPTSTPARTFHFRKAEYFSGFPEKSGKNDWENVDTGWNAGGLHCFNFYSGTLFSIARTAFWFESPDQAGRKLQGW